MNTEVMVLLFIGFALFMAARVTNERSYKHLNKEQKADLFDLFSNMRYWSLGFVVVVLIILFGNMYFHLTDLRTVSVMYVVLFSAYFIFISRRSYVILTSADYPKEYIRHYLIATGLRFLGILIMFLGLLSSN